MRALLELPVTVGELASRGFNLYKISPKPLEPHAPVYGAGIPLADIPDALQRLTGMSCEVKDAVDLKEGDYTWQGAGKTNCHIAQGWSGAGLFDEAQGVVGILNTRVEPEPGEPCSLDHPCEDRDGNEVIAAKFKLV